MCLAKPMATASRQAHATADDLSSRAARNAGRRGRPPPLLPGAVQRLCQGSYQPARAVICMVSRAISGQCSGAQESLHMIAPPVQEGEQICTRSRLHCPRSSCATCTPIGGRPITSPSAKSTCTDLRGHLNKKVRFRACVAPSTSFLIDRTSFSVILRDSSNQVGDLGSLFHVHTTSCRKKG